MRWTRLFVLLVISLWAGGCRDDLGYMEPTATPTRIVARAVVVSTNPDVVVESWKYLGPQAEESLRLVQGTRFGPERYEASVQWRPGGFDLMWGTFPCSIQPILTIGEGTIELWLNEGIWDDCDAMQASHALRVEVTTDIPPGAWSYAIHEGAPSDGSSASGRTVTGQIVASSGERRPVARALLQLEPGGEFVAETDASGRFTLTDIPFTETTVYASHLRFVIPAGEEVQLDLGIIDYPLVHPPLLALADYPPGDRPYYVASCDCWLVRHPDGTLLAFVPFSPDYREDVTVAACRFTWNDAVRRFVDPCSGDEWELDGVLNLAHSAARWSSRDLDQYAITVQEGTLMVHLDQVITGTTRDE